MKRQKKTFIILLIVVAVLAVLYVVITLLTKASEKKEEEAEAAAEIHVTDIDASDVTKFTVEKADSTITLSLNDDGDWINEADPLTALDQDQVENLIEKFASVDAEESFTDYDSLSDYGLETPSYTVTMETSDGITVIKLGDTNTTLSRDYLLLDGDDTVYLVVRTYMSALEFEPEDLIAQEEETETESELAETESVTEVTDTETAKETEITD